jgi:hypothetical protein
MFKHLVGRSLSSIHSNVAIRNHGEETRRTLAHLKAHKRQEGCNKDASGWRELKNEKKQCKNDDQAAIEHRCRTENVIRCMKLAV